MTQGFISVIAVTLAWAGAAAASDMQPAELPPADFTAGQYIDSRGCVFIRDQDQVWAPRLYRGKEGEELVCGFPPTLAPQPVISEGGKLNSAAEKTLEESLAEVVFPNLRDGEHVTDNLPFQPLPDMGPEPVDSGPVDLLQAEIAAQSAIRYAMAGAKQPNRELCRWLGYDGQPLPEGTKEAGCGHDPTQGFCGGLATSQLSRLVFARPAKMPDRGEDDLAAAEAESEAADHMPQVKAKQSDDLAKSPVQILPVDTVQAAAEPSKVRGLQKLAMVTKGKERASAAEAMVIPAHARYVQVGIYSDSAEVERIVQRLSELGLPALRQLTPSQPGKAVILSGPFLSRQAIVIALSRIKSAGFPDAVPK